MRETLFRTLYEANEVIGKSRRSMRRRLGFSKPSQIVGYRGYGHATRALVQGRLLEHRNIRPSEERSTILHSAVASYKRYMTWELPGERIAVNWGEHSYTSYTDGEGFFEVWVEPPEHAAAGWNEVEVEHRGRKDPDLVLARATLPVHLTGPQTEYGIISDIDDTVIETGVTNPLKRAYALFLSEARVRPAFDGVCAFYEALEHGMAGAGQNPIFYVSSSPWNLYEHLEEFFRMNDVPPGPMFLRDWGITPEGIAPGGGHGHKLAKIRRILDTFPDLPFVLIGDSGQEDAQHYATIAAEYPGRVLAIYIRMVRVGSKRQRRLERLAASVDVPLIFAENTATAARDAAQRGLIRDIEITAVDEAVEEDREASGLLDGPGE